jgi:hypothetical protein
MHHWQTRKTGVFRDLLVSRSENNAQLHVFHILGNVHFAYQTPKKRIKNKITAATAQASITGLSIESIMLPPAVPYLF